MNKYKLVDCSLKIKDSKLLNARPIGVGMFRKYQIIALGHIGKMIQRNDLLFIPVLFDER